LSPGGGAYWAIVLNSSPTKPLGVQLIMPIVPPGRVTRSISLAARSWSGANIAPIADST